MQLVVTHQEIEGDDGRVVGATAWRVAVRRGDILYAIPVEFARERDAALAREAIRRAGIHTADELRCLGLHAVRQIMLEALPW